jgi:PAS domain S-box-containing protein
MKDEKKESGIAGACIQDESLFLAQASVDRSSDTIVWLDKDAKIIYVNDAAEKTLGYSKDELLGMTIHEVDPDFPPHAWLPHLEEIKKAGSLIFESHHRKKDGTIFPVEVTCNYFEHDGSIYSFAFNRDITERKKIEEALKLTQFSVDRASENLFWLDENARLIYVNDSACSTLGYSRDELLSMTIHEVDPDFPREAWLPHIEELRKAGSLTFESRHKTKDGRAFPVEVTGNYIEYNGRFYSFAFDHDISERKRVESELEQYRKHLEKLVEERTAELRQAMEQLVQSEKLAALGHLVAGVAHELNTPLGNTRMVASTLSEDLVLFEKALQGDNLRRSDLETFLNRSREAVKLLESNSSRAAELIGQFKQVAIDQTSMRRRKFNLLTTMNELLATLQPQFRHTSHIVEIGISPDIDIDSYPGPLGQVIANLAGNSLLHAFNGIDKGIIRIDAEKTGQDYITINYSDNGCGIPEENRKRIFEPFYTTRLGQGGSGLGLYIVYNLVTGVLGGSITIDPGCREGVSFIIKIPVKPAER